MSGRKKTKVKVRPEVAEALRLRQRMQSLQGEIKRLGTNVQNLLDRVPQEARSRLGGQEMSSRQWLDLLRGTGASDAGRTPTQTIDVGPGADIQKLQGTVRELEQTAEEGRRAQEVLVVAGSPEQSETAQRLARRLAEVRALCASAEDVVRQWHGEQVVLQWHEALQSADRMLMREEYGKLESSLAALEHDLTAKRGTGEEQEGKHQKRLYVLKALRQVCAEMGFEELADPRFEQAGNRGSRILLTVDTLGRGKIAFSLSLDGISTRSEIADDRCFEDFGRLSEYLGEQFGVETHFRTDDGTEIPKLRAKGEMEEPQDGGLTMER